MTSKGERAEEVPRDGGVYGAKAECRRAPSAWKSMGRDAKLMGGDVWAMAAQVGTKKISYSQYCYSYLFKLEEILG